VLKGTERLLQSWGVEVATATTYAEAIALEGQWDLILADHHLDGPETGLDIIARLSGSAVRSALVTANATDEIVAKAAAMGVRTLRKPVAPASLRAFLASLASPVGGSA
jgi:CheY-like chemotaxis protein